MTPVDSFLTRKSTNTKQQTPLKNTNIHKMNAIKANEPIHKTNKYSGRLDLNSEERLKDIHDNLQKDENFPSEIPVKETIGKFKLMNPQKFAENHPANTLLKEYADKGCPVNYGPDWDLKKLLLYIEKGPHVSALIPAAITQLQEETKQKITNGYARTVKWKDIKDDIPKKLKISPLAMIPHKSKKYRCILDLSFSLNYDGAIYDSVNDTTVKLAKQQSMTQLGSTLQRLVALMAKNHDLKKPFKFTKLDIKDGFWHMAVNDLDAWNFCYILPSHNKNQSIDDMEIVVPNSLQMGWCESPPSFCTASETARDIIDKLYTSRESLEEHRLENAMLININKSCPGTIPKSPSAKSNKRKYSSTNITTTTITEVFGDILL